MSNTVDNFNLFSELSLQLTENKKETNCLKNKEDGANACDHSSISDSTTLRTCTDCGKEFDSDFIFDKEWRYYGSGDGKNSSNPSRCQVRKNDTKGIEKDIKNMGFTDKIIEDANDLYKEVTKGKIFRGNSRKSIIFACVFNAYKMNNAPRSCEELIKTFNLEKKIGLRGIKYIHLNLSSDSKVREIRITPHHIITEMLKKFQISNDQIDIIQNIYDSIKNKSSVINRSRPTSIAAGVIYYYIQTNNKQICLKDFASVVGLSELTIKKIVKEITLILKSD